MTGDEFKAAGIVLFGDHWVSGLMDFLGMSERSVRKFAAGSKTIGPDFSERLYNEIAFLLRSESESSPTLRVLLDALARRNQPAGD